MKKNKPNNKVNSIDSSTLDYYNDDMSKRAVGKLFQNVTSDEGVRPISRDEYDTLSKMQKHSQQNDSIDNYTYVNNDNKSNDNLDDFIKQNQTVNTNSNKKFDTLHKAEIKDRLQKLSTSDNLKIDKQNTPTIDSYVHNNTSKEIDNPSPKKENTKAPSVFIDDFSPATPKQKQPDIHKNKNSINKKSEPVFRKPHVNNNKFNDDNYFATLRTSRLSPENVELDYENLPYSTQAYKELSHNVEKKLKKNPRKETFIDDDVIETADKHIDSFKKADNINESLVNIVRQSTQEMEKQKILDKEMESKRTTRNSNKFDNHNNPSSQRNNNPRVRRQQTGYMPKQSSNKPQKPNKKRSNPTVAFIRIASFIVIILLSVALINSMVKNAELQSTIKEQERNLENYESLNQQITELRLEKEELLEQLMSYTNNNVLQPVDNNENLPIDDIANENSLPTEYTVVAGDNLVKISQKFYDNKNDYNKIIEANNLTNDNIHVGQVLVIPE